MRNWPQSVTAHPGAVGSARGWRALSIGELLLLLTGLVSLPAAAFGGSQIISTTFRQLSGPAEMVDYVAFFTGARLLLEAPGELYQLDAWTALQSALHLANLPLLQFWNPPHTALLLAPLGWLPFGASYAVFLGLNLVCLAAAWLILVPASARSARGGLVWALGLMLFLPVQLGLVMGQLCFALLLGFAGFVWLLRRGAGHWPGVALLPWTFKPQLLPILLVSLALARRWRALACAALLPSVLCLAVLGLGGGLQLFLDYVQLAGWASSGVITAEGTHLDAGHSVLGIAQWLVGPGSVSSVLMILGTLLIWLLSGLVWRSGLLTDRRQHLQFALLPLAAVVTSPHALAYDAVVWLASAWLLLEYAHARPSARPLLIALVLICWWAGDLAVLPLVNTLAPWAGLAALVALGGILWLYWTDHVNAAR